MISSRPLGTAPRALGGWWLGGVTIALLLAALVGAQIARDRQYPPDPLSDRILYVRSGEATTRLALSFDALAADVYWMRAIQHYGGDRLSNRPRRYELLYPLLDLTTTLDPLFTIAYRFGAIFLAEAYPGGAGRPDLAIRLLQKGIRADGKWQYVHDIAFIHYWHTGDFIEAARWFERAAAIPGAPDWLRPMAAATRAQGGQRRASRFLWHQLRETAENEFMRNMAERRLLQLDALDRIDALEARIARYAQGAPYGPITWDRLIAAGIVSATPHDPAGTPLDLNPWWGTLSVSTESPLYPTPREPPPLAAAHP